MPVQSIILLFFALGKAVTKTSEDKWSRYWAGNRVSACMQDASGNYSDVIGRHWSKFFSDLPADSRVLDLATGNGAVLHFALATARASGKPLQLHGVDLAAINPWAHLQSSRLAPTSLDFTANTNIETLPFGSASFDAVVSQYGAEYADLDKVLAETARVLDTGGRLMWIMHSTDSIVYRNSQREIEDAQFMLEHAQPAVHLRALLKIQTAGENYIANAHQNTANTPQRQALDQALKLCVQRLQQRGQSEIIDHGLQNLAYLYQHRNQHPPATLLAKISEWETELGFFQQRLQALVDCALDAAQCAHLTSQLSTLGFIDSDLSTITKTAHDSIGKLLTATHAAAN